MGIQILSDFLISPLFGCFGQAVAENLCLKQQIFADIEKYCPQHSIFACNTSAFDLNAIGERTKSQNRIIGAHFFW